MCMILQVKVGDIENDVDPDKIVQPAASHQGSATFFLYIYKPYSATENVRKLFSQ